MVSLGTPTGRCREWYPSHRIRRPTPVTHDSRWGVTKEIRSAWARTTLHMLLSQAVTAMHREAAPACGSALWQLWLTNDISNMKFAAGESGVAGGDELGELEKTDQALNAKNLPLGWKQNLQYKLNILCCSTAVELKKPKTCPASPTPPIAVMKDVTSTFKLHRHCSIPSKGINNN